MLVNAVCLPIPEGIVDQIFLFEGGLGGEGEVVQGLVEPPDLVQPGGRLLVHRLHTGVVNMDRPHAGQTQRDKQTLAEHSGHHMFCKGSTGLKDDEDTNINSRRPKMTYKQTTQLFDWRLVNSKGAS